MPIAIYELNVFFDNLHQDLRVSWDNKVDDGEMTDYALHYRLGRMDAIGSILRALAEGQAALTYLKTEEEERPREPSPLIRLPWTGQDDG
jgi:hypothetical protein